MNSFKIIVRRTQEISIELLEDRLLGAESSDMTLDATTTTPGVPKRPDPEDPDPGAVAPVLTPGILLVSSDSVHVADACCQT